MRILISGASISGPVLAYWLARSGFDVTVVERAPALRKTGGHAVDLFTPAMDITDRMELTSAIAARETGTDILTLHREGHDGSVDIRQGPLFAAFTRRHVEIMRDDLSEVFYTASAPTAEYLFGDSVSSLAEDDDGVTVTFEHGPTRRFDLVIGADGLHSNIRGLAFGPDGANVRWLGEYLAVASIPNYLDLRDRMLMSLGTNRLAGVYSAAQMDDARALFLFRPGVQLDYHHHDIDTQKALLRSIYDEVGWEIPRLLHEAGKSDAFYMDSITQLRTATWSRGRVTLVGDAGYCPGPAVGGSTSLAITGAYVLAGEIAAAAGDYRRAYRAYEAAMADYVTHSRELALIAAKTLIPTSRAGVWGLVQAARVLTHLPEPITRTVARVGAGRRLRFHDTITVKNYQDPAAV